MDHGFTAEQFHLLRKWQNRRYDATDAAMVYAYDRLREAYAATEAWAHELQERLFPLGNVEIRKAVINQGQVFSPYTWAKIYPSSSAPKALAYTVGIDADGLTVKIDTVGNTPARRAYAALRGPHNEGSPFGRILPTDEAIGLSLENLVEWSAKAIGGFRMGYSEVLRRIGLGTAKLTLVADEAISRQAFDHWRDCLLDGGQRRGPVFWLVEGGIVFRLGRSGRAARHDKVELGIDPTGRTWAVQVNEPRIAGDFNSTAAIAVGEDGSQYLLRQGLLRPNERGGRTISGDEFIARTGLSPVSVHAEGLAAKRRWFLVSRLHSAPAEIRRNTSRFVDFCAKARASAEAGEAATSPAPADLFASDETGGTHIIAGRPAEGDRTIVRYHGIVYLTLAQLLRSAGKRVRKGRDPLGYEVDAEIDEGGVKPALVEIKTGISAGEIHAGVGQLHLYPKLIQRLAAYDRILLLPRRPRTEVAAAVEKCGIHIHTFDLRERAGELPEVTFSPAFLRRFAVAPVAK